MPADSSPRGDPGGAAAPDELRALLARVPLGWTEVTYGGRRWGLSRSDAVAGRAVSVYAEPLGGGDPVSTNLYLTGGGGAVLRPCEMPAAAVLAFLRGWRPRCLGSRGG